MGRSGAGERGQASPDEKGWTPGVVIACAVCAVLALCLAAAMPIIFVNEFWGVSPFDRVGTARPRPVWMVWLLLSFGLMSGLLIAGVCFRYLYRVARGHVPRRQG